MTILKAGRRTLAAAVILLSSVGAAWAFGGTIGGIYQDQVSLSSSTNNAILTFKLLGFATVIQTVSCRIDATVQPYEVSIAQTNRNGARIFLPISFVGQVGSNKSWTALATGLNYGISASFKPEMAVRWDAAGAHSVTCSISGK